MKRNGIILIGLLVALSAFISSCSDDSETNPGEAPSLPPQGSLSANLGNFPQNEGGRAVYAKDYFGFAAVNVGFWQTVLGASLVIPATAFDEAFDHSFTYLEDQGKWKSEYTVNVNGKSLTAQLFADRDDDGEEVKWEMYLSLEGQYEDFLWFTGESRTDNTGGEWTLYGGPGEPREVLEIEWEREDGAPVQSKYVLIDEQSDRSGSFIAYGETDEAGFSHYYEVSVESDSAEDYDATIYFNETTKEGRVKSESHYGDADWRCWDANFENTTCS